MGRFWPKKPADGERGRFWLGLTLVTVLLLATFIAFYFVALGFTDPKTFLTNWVAIVVLLAIALAAGGLNWKLRPAQPKAGVASVLTAFGAVATGIFADSKLLEAWKNPPFDLTVGSLVVAAVLACVPALLGWIAERKLAKEKKELRDKNQKLREQATEDRQSIATLIETNRVLSDNDSRLKRIEELLSALNQRSDRGADGQVNRPTEEVEGHIGRR